MEQDEQVAALRARLDSAEKARDTWRTAGMQEKYLEAYSQVEALTVQLWTLQASRAAEAQKNAMIVLGIRSDGRQYRYGDRRYDRLEDAIAHARLKPERIP